MKTRSASLACFLFLLQPVVAQALALSDIEIRSYLNQPLDAQVRLLAVTKSELDSLQVKVVAETGGTRLEFRPEIVQDENGSAIRITTKDSVREPILIMHVELSWSTGRLTREYSLIIDPR
jgi:pilus assembly protein FimV